MPLVGWKQLILGRKTIFFPGRCDKIKGIAAYGERAFQLASVKLHSLQVFTSRSECGYNNTEWLVAWAHLYSTSFEKLFVESEKSEEVAGA